jgi:endonuclease/exonuclease/phosphatase family metal-dependent hydrolase
MPTLATFNANNFFLRYQFAKTYPGDLSGKSAVAAADITLGYIPEKKFGKYLSKDFVVWDPIRRDLAAQALAEPDDCLPDILCLQEVENMDAIRKLNEDHFGGHYRYQLLIDGRDPRNIDVAVLSVFPIECIHSNLDVYTEAGSPLLSRDCLEVTLQLPKGEELTLFVNHLKSKFVDGRGKTEAQKTAALLAGHQRRHLQAEFVAKRVLERFKEQHDTALYAVVGDFNDTEESPWVAPLTTMKQLVDVIATTREPDDRWTYYYRAKGRVQQIDYILASKALAARVRKTHITRAGLGYREVNAEGEVLPKAVTLVHLEEDGVTPVSNETTPSEKIPFTFERYEPVFDDLSNNISDHCPVKVWF